MSFAKRVFGLAFTCSGLAYLCEKINGLRPTVLVLMYHRVAPIDEFDPHLISATPANFNMQMRYLRHNYKVISIEQLAHYRKKPNMLPKRAVIVTFDDGYLDNYVHAFPVLRKYQIPATVNLTTGYIEKRELLWWDMLEYAINNTKQKKIRLEGKTLALTDKRRAVKFIFSIMKRAEDTRRKRICAQAMRQLGVRCPTKRMFLNWKQVREMKEEGIEFGAHTESHAILTKISFEHACQEIMASKEAIEEQLSRPTIFAYPNGTEHDMNDRLDSFLKQQGFRFSLSTIYGINHLTKNTFRLKRVGIENDDDMRMFAVKLTGFGRLLAKFYERYIK